MTDNIIYTVYSLGTFLAFCQRDTQHRSLSWILELRCNLLSDQQPRFRYAYAHYPHANTVEINADPLCASGMPTLGYDKPASSPQIQYAISALSLQQGAILLLQWMPKDQANACPPRPQDVCA